MKTILRRSNIRLFFQGPDQWTKDPRKAFNFKSIDRALEFIKKWKLADVEVAFAFSDGEEVKSFPPEKVALDYCEK